MSKYKTWYFLSQLGRTVTIVAYLQKDVFKARLLSHVEFDSDWRKNM